MQMFDGRSAKASHATSGGDTVAAKTRLRLEAARASTKARPTFRMLQKAPCTTKSGAGKSNGGSNTTRAYVQARRVPSLSLLSCREGKSISPGKCRSSV